MSNTAFYRALEQATQRIAAGPIDGAAARVQHGLDADLAGMAAAPHRACRAGCAFCCHHPVGITWLEAERLCDALDQLPQDQQDRIADRLAGSARGTADLTWANLARQPCPLLEDDRCSVYDARPVPCRSFASFDRDACERNHRGAGDIPMDSEALAAGLGASAALAQATPNGDARELRAAMAAVLAVPPHDAAAKHAAFLAARRAGG